MPDSSRSHHWSWGDARPPCLHPNGRRKITYRSAAKARHASKAIASRGRSVKPSEPYQCRHCGLWHLTTKRAP